MMLDLDLELNLDLDLDLDFGSAENTNELFCVGA